MRWVMKCIIILLLLFLCTVNISDADDEFKFAMNGHDWNTIGEYHEGKVDVLGLQVLKRVAKLYYLKGIYMGVYTELMDEMNDMLCLDVSDEDLIMHVDLFYADPVNLNIPVPYALRVVGCELLGDDKISVNEKLDFLREKFGSEKDI